MRSVSVRLADLDKVKINLGIAGENEHTHVLFDCKKAFDQYPNATPFLIVTPPRGDIYPAVVTRDGDIVEWVVTDSDLIYHGNGKVQLQFKQGDIIMKSYEAMTSIAKSSEPTGTVPTPIQNWITQANAILASIPDDIAVALAEAKASGQFDGVGIASIAYKSTSGLVDTYTITLTDGRDYDFTVTNGTPGQNGVGIQSIAKTSTVGLVDTYTVTLTNGQTYPFTVTNGQNGVEIDDNTPANNKVFSSAKVDQELTDVKTAIHGVDKDKASIIYGSENGSIVKIKDGSDGLPIRKIQINIIPVQSGEGVPSLQNIRPFIGFTGCRITKINDNALDISQYDFKFNEMTIDKENDEIRNSKTYGGNASKITFSQVFSKGTYTIFGKVKGPGSSGLRLLSTAEFQDGTWNNSYQAYWKNFENNKLTFTVNESTKIGLIFITASGHDNEPATAYGIMLARGNGEEYDLSWNNVAGTLYGGKIEAISGNVKKTYGRIASYGGEELPGAWYSDRDVYEEGTYPTTGAEVVYELSEPTSYTITGININTKYGENNLWVNTDSEIDCVYRSDTELFLKKYTTEGITKVKERIICVNPKMFGAVGDGVTDDSAAMQSTFDYAKDNNVPIDVSNGCYLFENVVLYDGGRYEINGALSIENSIGNNEKRTPSLIVKHNSVGFIGNRSSQDLTVASLPTVYVIMRNILIKGQDGVGLFPVIFKDVKLTNAKIQNIAACWFSCFIEGIIKGNSIISDNEFHFFTECVFRAWTDKYNITQQHSFVDSKYYNNQFYGQNKFYSYLYKPTVFEGNYFYINGFENNFVAMVWGAVGLINGNNITAWQSKNNIYSFCPYFFVMKSEAEDPFIHSSVLINESIWHSAADTLKNTAEGKSYFDDLNGNSRITGEECPFYGFDSILATKIDGLILRDSDKVFQDITKFQYATITKAFPYVSASISEAENVRSAFDTKIPLSDYTQKTNGYKMTTIESWNGKTTQVLPTIEDENYRYVLEGQTCFYNNKLLICHDSNWYDAMGNVIS